MSGATGYPPVGTSNPTCKDASANKQKLTEEKVGEGGERGEEGQVPLDPLPILLTG